MHAGGKIAQCTTTAHSGKLEATPCTGRSRVRRAYHHVPSTDRRDAHAISDQRPQATGSGTRTPGAHPQQYRQAYDVASLPPQEQPPQQRERGDDDADESAHVAAAARVLDESVEALQRARHRQAGAIKVLPLRGCAAGRVVAPARASRHRCRAPPRRAASAVLTMPDSMRFWSCTSSWIAVDASRSAATCKPGRRGGRACIRLRLGGRTRSGLGSANPERTLPSSSANLDSLSSSRTARVAEGGERLGRGAQLRGPSPP